MHKILSVKEVFQETPAKNLVVELAPFTCICTLNFFYIIVNQLYILYILMNQLYSTGIPKHLVDPYESTVQYWYS